MNNKVLSEPKTMEDLVTYWAWKKLDLDRIISAITSLPEHIDKDYKDDIDRALITRIGQRNLIESLQRKHKYGEF